MRITELIHIACITIIIIINIYFLKKCGLKTLLYNMIIY